MKKFIKYLTNLKLAIAFLLLIAFSTSIGSIIEQDKPFDFYKQEYSKLIFNIPLWQYIIGLQLNHIYSTFWFFGLLVLFGICLISCTFLQQFPALKFARRYYFSKSKLNTPRFILKLRDLNSLFTQTSFLLNYKSYNVFQNYQGLYAYKGLVGKIGPVFVHASIIVILIGSILSSVQGFTGQELVAKSEIFHTQNIIRLGNLANLSTKNFRINDFWITYNKNNTIKQFQSDISILQGTGNEIYRKTINVNNPIVFNNLTIYQTDWGILGIRVKNNLLNLKQLPIAELVNQKNKLWVTWVDTKFNSGVLIVLTNERGQISIYDETGRFFKKTNLDEIILIDQNTKLIIPELITCTGLQLKIDPGIRFIYLGFALLIISSLMSYIGFAEIWVFHRNKQTIINGTINRGLLKLNLEIAELSTKISN